MDDAGDRWGVLKDALRDATEDILDYDVNNDEREVQGMLVHRSGWCKRDWGENRVQGVDTTRPWSS